MHVQYCAATSSKYTQLYSHEYMTALASKMQQPSHAHDTQPHLLVCFYMYTVHMQEGGIIEFTCGIIISACIRECDSTRMSLRETLRKTKPFYLVKYIQNTFDTTREDLLDKDLHEGARNNIKRIYIYIVEIIKIG